MRTWSPEEAANFEEFRMRWFMRSWCRDEVREVSELLATHVELGIATGTSVERIAAMLRRVRAVVLEISPKEAA